MIMRDSAKFVAKKLYKKSAFYKKCTSGLIPITCVLYGVEQTNKTYSPLEFPCFKYKRNLNSTVG